ncbi:C40 family peptidase [Actinomadura rupiterrae]|uniref:C40 family peptidase n=1 Tax=Actinomadura rupiterrae TaxID=559627 RepID=UPI0020A29A33|nr:bifunctional lytic transglycosylase/C40 family peptidase [Actinomadura rupiterrae]MCP2343722.1 cell wall-associated NlpC family hydrolase [Actinomadura rupiterrae]
MPLALGGAAGAFLVLLVAILGGLSSTISSGGGTGPTVCAPPSGTGSSLTGTTDIPPNYLALYVRAGQEYGIPWNILAAVGSVESDHGRSTEPGTSSGENYAGAGGPMQFLAGTWATFGIDGNHDGRRNRYDPADAIPTAARYLKHNGAPGNIRAALFGYNHSDTYVNDVLKRAASYAKRSGRTPSTAAPIGCASGPDAGFAAAPNRAAAKVISFARAQLGKPYVWGAMGPNAYDCSGLTSAAYRAAGISIPRVSGDQWNHEPRVPNGHEQPGDLVFFNSGPGTSTTNPGHVGLVIGPGKMIAAPHTGTVVQIQPYRRPTLLGFTRPRKA